MSGLLACKRPAWCSQQFSIRRRSFLLWSISRSAPTSSSRRSAASRA